MGSLLRVTVILSIAGAFLSRDVWSPQRVIPRPGLRVIINTQSSGLSLEEGALLLLRERKESIMSMNYMSI